MHIRNIWVLNENRTYVPCVQKQAEYKGVMAKTAEYNDAMSQLS